MYSSPAPRHHNTLRRLRAKSGENNCRCLYNAAFGSMLMRGFNARGKAAIYSVMRSTCNRKTMETRAYLPN